MWYHIANVQEAAIPLFLPCCNFARLEFTITLESFFLLAQKKSKLFFHIFVSLDLDKFNLEKPLPCLYFFFSTLLRSVVGKPLVTACVDGKGNCVIGPDTDDWRTVVHFLLWVENSGEHIWHPVCCSFTALFFVIPPCVFCTRWILSELEAFTVVFEQVALDTFLHRVTQHRAAYLREIISCLPVSKSGGKDQCTYCTVHNHRSPILNHHFFLKVGKMGPSGGKSWECWNSIFYWSTWTSIFILQQFWWFWTPFIFGTKFSQEMV